MASPIAPRIVRISGTASAIGAATETTLQVGADPGSGNGGAQHTLKVKIQRVKIKRVSGTAANFTPRIHSATPYSSGSIDQEWLGTATAVATLVDATAIEALCYTDNRGRLFLVFVPDAGADNVFNYAVYLEICS
jgi:hypothetical protein